MYERFHPYSIICAMKALSGPCTHYQRTVPSRTSFSLAARHATRMLPVTPILPEVAEDRNQLPPNDLNGKVNLEPDFNRCGGASLRLPDASGRHRLRTEMRKLSRRKPHTSTPHSAAA